VNMMQHGTRPHKKPPVPGSFGAAVRAIREEKHLSQVQLGEITGLGQNNISRIETSDVKRPQDATVRLLAEGLGVSPNAIWERTTYPEFAWQTPELRLAIKPLGLTVQDVMAHLAPILAENEHLLTGREPEEIADFFACKLRELQGVKQRNGAPA
jgi:transcriptional regulator with XRE-family HTH domain